MRALAAALVLVAVAAAGCGGGTSSTKEALNVAQASGGANPSVARIERVRAPNGEPVDVVLVRADYCAAGGNGASIPSPGGGCGPNYA